MKKKETTIDGPIPEADSPASKQKEIFLKQYLVSGSENIYDPNTERKAAFIMHTCAKNARDEFKSRFGMDVASCAQVADSTMTKDDMAGRDFWEEDINWEMECPRPEQTPAAKKYFRLKAKAEFVQAEKKRLGIKDWRDASYDQLDAMAASVSEWEKAHPA